MKIVVVGAGAIGLACGYELLQDGHDVVVLEEGRAGAAASHGNAAKIAVAEAGPVPAPGMVIQGLKWMLRSDSPLYIKPSLSPPFVRFMLQMARHCTERDFRAGLALNLELATAANDMFDEWAAAGLEFEMHQRGVLLAYEDADHFAARLRYQDVFDGFGADAEILDAAGVQRVEPALTERLRYGLYYAGDRQIEPDSLTAAIVAHIGKLGGQVREDSSVKRFVQGPHGVTAVVTADGITHSCDAVVLAAGVWTAALAAELGTPLPIQPGKGYSLDYAPAPLQLRTSLTLEDAHMAVTPLDGFVRLAGTMEFSGLNSKVLPKRVDALRGTAAAAFRDWDDNAPHAAAWSGMRPMTPDGLPVVGRLKQGANVWVASGHGMLGLTQAPTAGRAIRELLRGGPEDLRIAPRRFTLTKRRRRAVRP